MPGGRKLGVWGAYSVTGRSASSFHATARVAPYAGVLWRGDTSFSPWQSWDQNPGLSSRSLETPSFREISQDVCPMPWP